MITYQLFKGTLVRLVCVNKNGTRMVEWLVELTRDVMFQRHEVYAGPLASQRASGIPASEIDGWPWGFYVENKWSSGTDAGRVTHLYAKEVVVARTAKASK